MAVLRTRQIPYAPLLFTLLRIGKEAASLAGNGDGDSDVFLLTLTDDQGHTVRTSSAVQTITPVFDGDGSVAGYVPQTADRRQLVGVISGIVVPRVR